MPSSPLVPENDPSTLFTGSGMQPMVPYLLGKRILWECVLPIRKKCFRSQDIEEVGDNRHTTFSRCWATGRLGITSEAKPISWVWEF